MVKWTGSGRTRVRGDSAASHPRLSEYLSKARLEAGKVLRSIELGRIWSGTREVQIADDAIARISILDAIAGHSPIVSMEVLIAPTSETEERAEDQEIEISIQPRRRVYLCLATTHFNVSSTPYTGGATRLDAEEIVSVDFQSAVPRAASVWVSDKARALGKSGASELPNIVTIRGTTNANSRVCFGNRDFLPLPLDLASPASNAIALIRRGRLVLISRTSDSPQTSVKLFIANIQRAQRALEREDVEIDELRAQWQEIGRQNSFVGSTVTQVSNLVASAKGTKAYFRFTYRRFGVNAWQDVHVDVDSVIDRLLALEEPLEEGEVLDNVFEAKPVSEPSFNAADPDRRLQTHAGVAASGVSWSYVVSDFLEDSDELIHLKINHVNATPRPLIEERGGHLGSVSPSGTSTTTSWSRNVNKPAYSVGTLFIDPPEHNFLTQQFQVASGSGYTSSTNHSASIFLNRDNSQSEAWGAETTHSFSFTRSAESEQESLPVYAMLRWKRLVIMQSFRSRSGYTTSGSHPGPGGLGLAFDGMYAVAASSTSATRPITNETLDFSAVVYVYDNGVLIDQLSASDTAQEERRAVYTSWYHINRSATSVVNGTRTFTSGTFFVNLPSGTPSDTEFVIDSFRWINLFKSQLAEDSFIFFSDLTPPVYGYALEPPTFEGAYFNGVPTDLFEASRGHYMSVQEFTEEDEEAWLDLEDDD